MVLGILHLSDIHFRSNVDNPASRRAQLIASAALSMVPEVTHLMLCITGDVAHAGKDNEYEIASQFLKELSICLSKCSHMSFLGTF